MVEEQITYGMGEGADFFNRADMNGTSGAESDEHPVSAEDAALVGRWNKKIKDAEHRYKDVFEQMRKCRQLAKFGAFDDWINKQNYVVPILPRHINQTVANLYAKNPKAFVSRKRRLMYSVWDGKRESLEAAYQQYTSSLQMGIPLADPTIPQLLEEVATMSKYNAMLDKLAKTLEMCWDYYTSEQEFGFKQQLKAAVRRTKVCGVGYVKLGFQRELQPRPEITAQIADVTEKIAHAERLMHEMQEGEIQEGSADLAELQYVLNDLQGQEMQLVREGVVFDFPRSDEIIVDPACRHLKTLAGANWYAHKFEKTPEEVEEIYGIDVAECAVKYNETPNSAKAGGKSYVRFYEIWDKRNRQVFTICDGYEGFLRPPAEPDIFVEGFFNLFPIVFNEIEDEKDLIPPSDVWQARHIQEEYNRSREGLREHRIANRPYYVVQKQKMAEVDLRKISAHDAHEVLEIQALSSGEKIEDVLQRGPSAPIDPNQYEVEMHFSDLLRVVGSQEANLGAASGDVTATQSSIAESSRSASLADNVDDLDDVLSKLAKAAGHVMLMNLSKETVVEIAGPGCVWPETPMAREEVVKDLLLDIKAGSSGRPNKAAELANLERAMPFLTMLPGVNPEPFVRNYLDLLDIDVEDAIIRGLPSITALNSMMSSASGAAVGGRPDAQTANGANPMNDPSQQGGAGAQNMAGPPDATGPQPAYPTGAPPM